jgi:hypothetical protein
MFPGSIPRFVQAAALWRRLIIDGTVPASPGFRTWAEMDGQDGHGR